MVASHTAHSDTSCEGAVGGHTGKSLFVDSVLARQLSQQYFASVMQQSSSGVREEQPGAAAEQVAAHYHRVYSSLHFMVSLPAPSCSQPWRLLWDHHQRLGWDCLISP